MGKRYWRKAREGEQCDVFSPAVVEVTRQELLAEMPTEALVDEIKNRGHRVVFDSDGLLLWLEYVGKEAADG